jgi:hypothetical protein
MLELDAAKKTFLKPHALGGMLGQPYEESGCIKFLYQAFLLIGIPTTGNLLKDRHDWVRIDGKPQYGDVAVFQHLAFTRYHVGLMLDWHWMIQSSDATNGVARVDILREPWSMTLKGIWRHKECS